MWCPRRPCVRGFHAVRGEKRAASYFTEDASGGNVRLGLLKGREGLLAWMQSNPPGWGYESVWAAINTPRVVNTWVHRLPGLRSNGSRFAFEGLTEYLYAGEGRFSLAFTTPDLIGLERVPEPRRSSDAMTGSADAR